MYDMIYVYHYDDVTWTSRSLKSPVTRMFLTACADPHRRNIKVRVIGPLWGEFYRWPKHFPHKGPVTRKKLSFDDVIIFCQAFACYVYVPAYKSMILAPTGYQTSNHANSTATMCYIDQHCVTAVSVWTWWRHQMEIFSPLLAIVRGIHR